MFSIIANTVCEQLSAQFLTSIPAGFRILERPIAESANWKLSLAESAKRKATANPSAHGSKNFDIVCYICGIGLYEYPTGVVWEVFREATTRSTSIIFESIESILNVANIASALLSPNLVTLQQ